MKKSGKNIHSQGDMAQTALRHEKNNRLRMNRIKDTIEKKRIPIVEIAIRNHLITVKTGNDLTHTQTVMKLLIVLLKNPKSQMI